jgi:ACR3 family arsenite efflux pump ArsB
VFTVMLSVMAFVEVKDVGAAFKKLKPTGLALLTNFMFTPAFAWALGWLILRHYPDIWAGVILYTLTPCIGWYLIFTDLAEGDVPWGVSLLPWNLTLQIVLLPFYLWLLVGRVVPISVTTLLGSVGLYLIAPFALAYGVRLLLERARGREWVNGSLQARHRRDQDVCARRARHHHLRLPAELQRARPSAHRAHHRGVLAVLRRPVRAQPDL